MLLLHIPGGIIKVFLISRTVKKQSLPEIEGLSINVGLCEKGSDIVKAALHHSQVQSWGENKNKEKNKMFFTGMMERGGGGVIINNQL